MRADEVWVTNSVQELVPVTALRDEEGHVRKVGDGTCRADDDDGCWRLYREDTNRMTRTTTGTLRLVAVSNANTFFRTGSSCQLGKRTLIMGILNATPDSFSDGGRYNEVEAAVQHARQMAAEGADIIDIGGESTRPGFAAGTLEEELERVVPVIRAIRAALPDMPLSIDTYKAETARQALEAGAHIINDIWGLKADPRDGGGRGSVRLPGHHQP